MYSHDFIYILYVYSQNLGSSLGHGVGDKRTSEGVGAGGRGVVMEGGGGGGACKSGGPGGGWGWADAWTPVDGSVFAHRHTTGRNQTFIGNPFKFHVRSENLF